MPILLRDDGTPFVMQAYRELVTAGKKAAIIQRVRFLAEQHGQYVRLFKKGQDKYEAAFSREAGYLFGETIKQYFGNSDNLIFCESLINSTDVLLVIIRSGSVYLDAQLPAKSVRNELLPLTSEQEKYQVIVSGTTPIKLQAEDDSFSLPAHAITSFESLEAPLFPRLAAIPSLQLIALPLALKAERFSRQPSLLVTLFLVVTLMAMMISIVQHHFPLTTTVSANAAPSIDFYTHYNKALMSASPRLQLMETVGLIEHLYTLPGWQATHIQFKNQQYQVSVTSDGNDLETISAWADENGFLFRVNNSNATLTFASHLAERPKPLNIYSEQQVLFAVVDQLDTLLHQKHIHTHEIIHNKNLKEMQLSIELHNNASQSLLLIGDALQDLPIVINDINLSLNSATVSGTINLSIWGK